jgi:hypothetical protein
MLSPSFLALIGFQAANEQQKRDRERRDAEALAEEEAFRRAAMAKFAEDDRLEQMNAQKRRMKVGMVVVEWWNEDGGLTGHWRHLCS